MRLHSAVQAIFLSTYLEESIWQHPAKIILSATLSAGSTNGVICHTAWLLVFQRG